MTQLALDDPDIFSRVSRQRMTELDMSPLPDPEEPIREVKLDVPYLRQSHRDGCGPTNLAMVLNYNGFDVDEEELYQFMPRPGKGADTKETLEILASWKESQNVNGIKATGYIFIEMLFPAPAGPAVPEPKYEEPTIKEICETVLRKPQQYFRWNLTERQHEAETWLQLFNQGMEIITDQFTPQDMERSIDDSIPFLFAQSWHWHTIVGYVETKGGLLIPTVHNSSKDYGGPFQRGSQLVDDLQYSGRDIITVEK